MWIFKRRNYCISISELFKVGLWSPSDRIFGVTNAINAVLLIKSFCWPVFAQLVELSVGECCLNVADVWIIHLNSISSSSSAGIHNNSNDETRKFIRVIKYVNCLILYYHASPFCRLFTFCIYFTSRVKYAELQFSKKKKKIVGCLQNKYVCALYKNNEWMFTGLHPKIECHKISLPPKWWSVFYEFYFVFSLFTHFIVRFFANFLPTCFHFNSST